jgi:hypothetical protein
LVESTAVGSPTDVNATIYIAQSGKLLKYGFPEQKLVPNRLLLLFHGKHLSCSGITMTRPGTAWVKALRREDIRKFRQTAPNRCLIKTKLKNPCVGRKIAISAFI